MSGLDSKRPGARPLASDRRGTVTSSAQRRVAALAHRLTLSLPVRCLRRFVAIRGRDRALVLGGQAFTTLIPLLIIVAAVTGREGSAIVADRLTTRFRLTGSSAEALRTLFARPPGASGAITIFGALLMLLSLLSLTRSLQRTFEAAWQLPAAGVRGAVDGLTGMGLFVASALVTSLLTSALRTVPGSAVISSVVRALALSMVWLVLARLLLSWRVGFRQLIPGAVIAGIGQTVISLYSALWMPRVIEQNAGRYGVIGVTFALLSWLIVCCFAVVLSAVVSAEAGGAAEVQDAAAAGSSTPGDGR